MNLTSGEVTTTSCHAQYSYICLSASRQGKRRMNICVTVAEPVSIGCYMSSEEPVAPEEEEIVPVEESADNCATRRALYIVLPFFFFCYGGSCILYCMHKIYK